MRHKNSGYIFGKKDFFFIKAYYWNSTFIFLKGTKRLIKDQIVCLYLQRNSKKYFFLWKNKERKHRTSVYILIVDKEFEDWEEHTKLGRVRRWFNLAEAKYELEKHKPIQGSYLNLLKGFERLNYYNNSTSTNNIVTYPTATITTVNKSDNDTNNNTNSSSSSSIINGHQTIESNSKLTPNQDRHFHQKLLTNGRNTAAPTNVSSSTTANGSTNNNASIVIPKFLKRKSNTTRSPWC